MDISTHNRKPSFSQVRKRKKGIPQTTNYQGDAHLHIVAGNGICSCIPRRVRVHVANLGILNLAHSGTTTDTATEVGTTTTARHDVHDKRSDESGPAEPEEGGGGLRLATVLLRVGGAVCYAVGEGIGAVAAAVRTKVRGQSDGGAEAEENTQCIHGDVDNGDAELLDEGSREEVQQREQPPYTHEEGVVDDRVHARVGARNVVTHERSHNDGADELPCSEAKTCGLHFL